MSATATSTGYGHSTNKRLFFDGNHENFELWEVKFLAYLRLNDLHKILETEPPSTETPDAAAVAQDAEKNAKVFAAVVQYLDDTSLSLIIRDAKDDGRKAMKILREHYIGCTKPRIISLYCELTSLKMMATESVTDYVLRAETAASRLKQAEENISDSLLISMIVKGLPDSYNSFTTVICQMDDKIIDFAKFKTQIRSFEENQNARRDHDDNGCDVISKADNSNPKSTAFTCFICKEVGHKSYQCPKYDKKKNSRRWCANCKTTSHDTRVCNKKKSGTSAKSLRTSQALGDASEETTFVFKAQSFEPRKSNDLLIDCGATAHIITCKDNFINFDNDFNPENHIIELADGSRQQGISNGRGEAVIYLKNSIGKTCRVILENALYMPTYKQNIISVSCLNKQGVQVVFNPNDAKLVAANGTIFPIHQNKNLYYVNFCESISNVKTRSLKEWHSILGHCNNNDILKLEKVVEGMNISDKSDFDCTTCIKSKMCQYRNHNSDPKASKILELVHTDIAGPIDPISNEKCKYSINFIDDYSGLTTVYFIRNKSDAAAAFEQFLADMAPYGKVLKLRSDCAKEYESKEFNEILIKNCIKHEFSAPYSAHQNGTAERSWRTLFNYARCLLNESGLPRCMWTYAVRAAAYIKNRCINNRLNVTPFEAFTSKKPNLSKMEQFGSMCFAYVQQKKKLDNRAEQGIFVGYDTRSPSYLVYFKGTGAVKKVRVVEFPTLCNEDDDEYVPPLIYNGIEKEEISPISTKNVEPDPPLSENPPKRYPERIRKKPDYLSDYVTTYLSQNNESNFSDVTVDYLCKVNNLPTSYEEALKSPFKNNWMGAMKEEMKSFEDNETFTLVPKSDQSVISGRWVFTNKIDQNSVTKFKARFVAKGFQQSKGVDYEETFSPTAKMTSVRMLMAIASCFGMKIHQMDVKGAYLNAKIDKDLYIQQPPGFVKIDENGNEFVLKLNKSIYGLKQSGRNWFQTLQNFLLSLNFVQSASDNCIFIKNESDTRTLILIWVDDILISSTSILCINDIKSALSNKFKMKDFGKIGEFLGIQFEEYDNLFKMHQEKFIDKLLTRFDMEDCFTKPLPCDASVTKIDFISDSPILENKTLFREIIGSLIYLMSCTRPDISFIVNKLAQNMENPSVAYLNAAKDVLRYLKGSKNVGLIFNKQKLDCPSQLDLIGYSDSDWGMSSDRRSTSGYCFRLNASALVSWKTKKQPTVALSSCEAEYLALTTAVQESLFLKQILGEIFNFEFKNATIFVDNQGTMALAKNPVYHQRSKHIDIRFHFIRYHIHNESIILKYIKSDENLADLFTKPFTRAKIEKFHLVNK